MPNDLFEYDDDGNLTHNGLVAADFDEDGDVDTADFTAFQHCFNGSNNPPGQDCQVDADFDDDGDVDMDDFSAFTACHNGVNNPPACAGMRPMKYTWDAENRLVEAEPLLAAWEQGQGQSPKKVRFAYDHQNRRVRKQVWLWNGTAWAAEADWRFVWDGWNLVEVIRHTDGPPPTDTVVRKYTWGLDLSGLNGNPSAGGIHGAGGIGGLLAAYETQGTESTADDASYWYFHDGNGNVGQILATTTDAQGHITDVVSTPAAHYEYDPYGNVIGPDVDGDGKWTDDATTYALANPIRFSTRWFDPETGAGYWPWRYYLPRIGRWMSRDPIEEKGGLNLSAFLANDPPNRQDPLGLQCIPGATCAPIPPPGPPVPRRNPAQCCQDAKAAGLDRGHFGGVVCCDGQKVACAWYRHTGNPARDFAVDIIIRCTTEHEKEHFDKVSCPGGCPPQLTRPKPRFLTDWGLKREECGAYRQELKCLRSNRANCPNAPDPRACRKRIDVEINTVQATCETYCGGPGTCP